MKKKTARTSSWTEWCLQHQRLLLCAITALLFLVWLPVKLSLYPAAIPGDGFVMLNQAAGLGRIVNNHSVLYVLLLRGALSLGKAFSLQADTTLFLFTELQSLIAAFVLTWFLLRLLTRKAPLWFVGLALVFFALEPVIPVYSITVLKDTPYALSFVVFCVLLLDVVRAKQKPQTRQLVALGCAGLAVSLFRNQGIYSVLLALVVAAIFLRPARRGLVKVALACGAFIFVLNVAYYALNMSAPATDPYGVMIQQVARVLAGEKQLTHEDEQVISHIMPLQDWKKLYVPYIVDPIKWSPTFSDEYFFNNQRAFVHVWLREFLRYPGIYMQAWAFQTKGFWDPLANSPWQYAETDVRANSLGVKQINVLRKLTGIDTTSALATDKMPRYFITPGVLVWLTVIVSGVLIMRRRARLLIVLVPALSTIAIMLVSTPLAYSLRYVLCLVLTLPLMLYLPFSPRDTTQAENQKTNERLLS